MGLDKEIVKDRKRLTNTCFNNAKLTLFDSNMCSMVGEVIVPISHNKKITLIFWKRVLVVVFCVPKRENSYKGREGSGDTFTATRPDC